MKVMPEIAPRGLTFLGIWIRLNLIVRRAKVGARAFVSQEDN